jgi:putative transposase
VQKGNLGKKVFFSYNDRIDYLQILSKQCSRAELMIQGYCLMDNHVHLIATPKHESSLASAVGQAHHIFSQHMNAHWKRSGHVWEQRFYSCPMDENHFVRALLYVDRNPVRAGLVKMPTDWPWSSARVHAGGHDIVAALVDPEEWRELAMLTGWDELAKGDIDQATMDTLRSGTRTGRPLGDDRFLNAIEDRLGYPVRRGGVGRPSDKK